MARLLPILTSLLLAGSPLVVQAQETDTTLPHSGGHDGMDHGNMDHSQVDMPGMGMSGQDMKGMDHSAHAMPESTVSDEPGDAPPPAPPTDFPAERFFEPDRMAASRAAMIEEMTFRTFALQVDQLELRTGKGGDGFGWDGRAWYGGDIDRIVLASEGEGTFAERAERIELGAYWRHALDPWFNLQLGMRQDFRPDPQRTYALVGIEGLAPYWFDVQGQLLVSNKGDVHARGKASYTQRITQSLVVEPEAEVDFAFQDVPALNVGAGFERLEMGARLRYDHNRSLAPYVGVNWERRLGGTARIAQVAGEDVSGVSVVFGVRAMF
ncbi:copper resistance protein CopB [Novosphingobium barchaimii LL02]|uniref:Copper resistance protein CopB n=1 Tax=Novosphingobium barchaimii LL02 TaxID=1114963 RepID=A0A0J7XL89_9SPHN|nr:copper resistance protein B [Novosphingobium barchaimii]KMS51868.1 copper resistance protein CopB [Novosphingobium barchaimii LL02]